MKNKIVIGSLFAVLLLVSLSNVSAINDIYSADSFESKIFKNTDNILEKNKVDNSIWELFDIYIELMYHLRLARVQIWLLIANLAGMTGTILSLINLRAYLLETRATVSREVLGEILDVVQDIMP